MAGIVEKLQKMWNPPDDEYDEYYDEEPVETPAPQPREYREPVRRSIARYEDENKVVNINAKTQLQVVLFKPISFGEETRKIAESLIRKNTVVLNLEKTDRDASRRILDFLSGVAYANNGKIKRIATKTFIITPYNVDLTGDEVLDELENSGIYF